MHSHTALDLNDRLLTCQWKRIHSNNIEFRSSILFLPVKLTMRIIYSEGWSIELIVQIHVFTTNQLCLDPFKYWPAYLKIHVKYLIRPNKHTNAMSTTYFKIQYPLSKLCWSRSAGFWWIQLIKLHTVFQRHQESILTMKKNATGLIWKPEIHIAFTIKEFSVCLWACALNNFGIKVW